MFELFIGTKVFFGKNCLNSLESILNENGWNKLALIVDHNIIDILPIKTLLSSVSNMAGKEITIGLCSISEPTYDFLEELRINFQGDDFDAVVGIGGGSALDAAKAIAVLMHNKKPAIHYRGFNKMTEPVLPIVVIPTTAGTGSEVTPNASFIDSAEKRKLGINGESVRPKYAILDPALTLTCPERATVSSGVDSMVHAIEAYVAQKTNPIARLFARDGFANVFKYLPLVLREPGNHMYREKVMYGAFLSGIALMHSGTGPAAAMSYPLGVHFRVPHGIGGAVFLPFVIEHNVNCGYAEYADLYDAIHPQNTETNKRIKANLLVEELRNIWGALAIPDDLTKLGVTPAFAEQFIQETLDLKGALDQNPVPFHKNEIASVLGRLHVQTHIGSEKEMSHESQG